MLYETKAYQIKLGNWKTRVYRIKLMAVIAPDRKDDDISIQLILLIQNNKVPH